MSFFNQTNQTNFIATVQNDNKTKSFVLNVQKTNLPNMRITETDIPSFHGIARSMIPGTSFEFDPLTITFIVDEQMDSYIEIYKWLLSINNYQTGISNSLSDTTCNIVIDILDNNKINIPVNFEYVDAFPTELSDIEFSYSEESLVAMTCSATFRYKQVNIWKNNEKIC